MVYLILFVVFIILYYLLIKFLFVYIAPLVLVYGSFLVSLVLPVAYGYTLYSKYRSNTWRDIFLFPVGALILLITVDFSTLLLFDLLRLQQVGGGREIYLFLNDITRIFNAAVIFEGWLPKTVAGFHYTLLISAMIKSIPIMPLLLLTRGLKTTDTDSKQPAFIQYFFKTSFDELKKVLTSTSEYVAGAFVVIFTWITTVSKGGQLWFIWPLTITAYIALIPPALTALVFGTILLLLHLFGLVVVLAVCYPVAALFFILERAVMIVRQGYVKCPHAGCHEPLPLPIFICPKCGARHDRLIPGRYGIFRRRCTCGNKLPTFFWFGKGRLPSLCAHCKKPIPSKLFAGSVHIPIYGGTASGKTMFMMAATYEMVEGHLDNLKTSHIREQDRDSYNKNWKVDFENGRVREKTASTLPNAFLLSLHRTGGLPISLYMYDPAGEAMVSTQDLQGHRFLKYYDSMALIIDPLTIKTIINKYGDKHPEYFQDGVTRHEPLEIVQHVINELEKQAKLSRVKKYKRRLAVLISKADLPFVQKELNVSLKEPAGKSAWNDIGPEQSQTIEKWLGKNEPALLQLLKTQFEDIHFFAISSLGSEPKPGVSFKPKNIKKVLHYLLAKKKALLYPQTSHILGRVAELAAAAIVFLVFLSVPYVGISYAVTNFNDLKREMDRKQKAVQTEQIQNADTNAGGHDALHPFEESWTTVPLSAASFVSTRNSLHSFQSNSLLVKPSNGTYTWVKQPYNCEQVVVECDVYAAKDHDIYIALAAPDYRKDTFYEIVIGGWNNTKTVIRKRSQGPAIKTSGFTNQKGVWQKIRVLKNKNQITVTANDKQVISLYDPTPIKGQYIGFSSWDNHVYYANIRIAIPGSYSSTSSSRSKQNQYEYFPSSQVTVRASSELSPLGSYSYGPNYTLDNNLNTAWSEGVKGYGTGQYIEYTFPKTVQLAAVKVANGYQKSKDLHAVNSRIKTARLDFDNNQSHYITFNDVFGWEKFDFPKLFKTRKMRLTITEVYPGKKYQDVLISDIKFLIKKI